MRRIHIFLIILILFTFSACSNPAPSITPSPTPISTINATARPTPSPTPSPDPTEPPYTRRLHNDELQTWLEQLEAYSGQNLTIIGEGSYHGSNTITTIGDSPENNHCLVASTDGTNPLYLLDVDTGALYLNIAPAAAHSGISGASDIILYCQISPYDACENGIYELELARDEAQAALTLATEGHSPFEVSGKVYDYNEERLLMTGTAMPEGEYDYLPYGAQPSNVSIMVENYRGLNVDEDNAFTYHGVHYFLRREMGININGVRSPLWVYGDPPESAIPALQALTLAETKLAALEYYFQTALYPQDPTPEPTPTPESEQLVSEVALVYLSRVYEKDGQRWATMDYMTASIDKNAALRYSVKSLGLEPKDYEFAPGCVFTLPNSTTLQNYETTYTEFATHYIDQLFTVTVKDSRITRCEAYNGPSALIQQQLSTATPSPTPTPTPTDTATPTPTASS